MQKCKSDIHHAFAVINHSLWERVKSGLCWEEAEALAEAIKAKGMRAILKIEETGVSVYQRPLRVIKGHNDKN